MMQGIVKRLNQCGQEPINSTRMRLKAVTTAIIEYSSSEGDGKAEASRWVTLPRMANQNCCPLLSGRATCLGKRLHLDHAAAFPFSMQRKTLQAGHSVEERLQAGPVHPICQASSL
jgi:hypothetical protein